MHIDHCTATNDDNRSLACVLGALDCYAEWIAQHLDRIEAAAGRLRERAPSETRSVRRVQREADALRRIVAAMRADVEEYEPMAEGEAPALTVAPPATLGVGASEG